MSVCRFFLQGTCKFGDRCRFKHPEPDNVYGSYGSSFNRNEYGGQERYTGRDQNYGQQRQSRYSYTAQQQNAADYWENMRQRSVERTNVNTRYESPERYNQNQRYDSPGRYGQNQWYNQNQRYQSPERYSQNQRYESPERYGQNQNNWNARYDSRNQRYNSPVVSNRDSQRNTYEKHNKYEPVSEMRTQSQRTDGRYKENEYNQNRYQWVSDDYKKQMPQKSQVQKSPLPSFSTSTPKSNVTFSFKVPDSEKNTKKILPFMNEENKAYAEIVKEDTISWELGEQWPFTCYCPFTDKSAFPGFTDISPEELRYEAYKAKENNSFHLYVESFQKALLDVKSKRNNLKEPSAELLSTIDKIRKGEDFSFSSSAKGFSFMQSKENTSEDMVAGRSLLQTKASASSFSFKLPPSDSVSKISASNFSFKLSPENNARTSAGVSSGPGINSDIYTPLENLTELEKEQFTASTFVLGKIPTKPPPHVLCF